MGAHKVQPRRTALTRLHRLIEKRARRAKLRAHLNMRKQSRFASFGARAVEGLKIDDVLYDSVLSAKRDEKRPEKRKIRAQFSEDRLKQTSDPGAWIIGAHPLPPWRQKTK